MIQEHFLNIRALIFITLNVLGYGESVSTAVEMAARDALKRLFCTTENMKPIPFTLDVSPMSDVEFRQNVSVKDWTSAKVQNVVQC